MQGPLSFNRRLLLLHHRISRRLRGDLGLLGRGRLRVALRMVGLAELTVVHDVDGRGTQGERTRTDGDQKEERHVVSPLVDS